MVKKTITLQKAYEVIALNLKQLAPNFNFDSKIDDNVYEKISISLAGTKYGYKSIISLIINDRLSFRNYFLIKYQKNQKEEKYPNKLFGNKLKDAFTSCKINPNLIAHNWRKSSAVYETLCKELGLQNSLKNRKKIYTVYRQGFTFDNINIDNKIHNETKPSSENVSQNSTEKVQISPMKSSFDGCDETLLETNNVYGSEVRLSDPNVQKCISSKAEEIAFTKMDITPENFEIADEIANLSSPLLSETVLPQNGTNCDDVLKNLRYEDCTILEGTFEIDKKIWDIIFDGNKLVKLYYPYYIKNRIKKLINNVCVIVFKYVKYNKKTGQIIINGICKHNNYNCKKFKIEIRNRIVSVLSTSLNYNHPYYLTQQVSGIERTITKRKLFKKKPSAYKKDTLLSSNQNILKDGKNLQNIKSDAVLRRIRSEALSNLDRDKNDLIDVILMMEDHSEYVKEISIPFNVKLYSLEQLDILLCEKKDKELPIIHFDATGSVVKRPPLKNCKQIYFYTAVVRISSSQRICPIFSMISSTHDSNTIFKLLHDFRYFCESHNHWPAFSKVVSDFSFANLHAISKAFNMCSLSEYIEKCYYSHTDNLIGIHLCCAHFLKMVAKDIDKLAKNKHQALYFKDLIALATKIENIDLFDIFVTQTYILLNSEFNNNQVSNSVSFLEMILVGTNDKITISPPTLKSSSTSDPLELDSQDKGLLKSSPYYKRAFDLITPITFVFDHENTERNKYFNKEVFSIILNKYIPLAPLWNSQLLQTGKPLSNSLVENYFGQLKNVTLEGERNIKCSNFIRKVRKEILALHLECKLKIKKSRLTKKGSTDATEEKQSQEIWSKKKKVLSTHFDARYLKRQTSKGFENTNEVIFPEDDDEISQCIYCGHGISGGKTAFVSCDVCKKWVHQSCVTTGNETDYDFEGEFICKFCEHMPESLKYTDIENSDNFRNSCEKHLKNITLSTEEISELEMKTRKQRLSPLWYSERKIRVTSSFFGRVCKVRESSSFENIIKNILEQKTIKSAAVAHEIKNEPIAIQKYLQANNFTQKYTSVGLCIHKQHPFLAASPGGFIDENGVIEIKCPYTSRYADPAIIKFDFLNKDQTHLLVNSNYNYQVQGILEITDRDWCDLVIYTFKGIKVIRILRSRNFFNLMLEKLKNFYYFYMIPQLIKPQKSLTFQERKWRTEKEIVLLNNGLVADINFYKALRNNRGYFVSVQDDMKFSMKELLIDDYLTLDENQWLSNFVVDHCLYILNKKKMEFQILSVSKSSVIFGDEDLNENFIKSITFISDKIIMPIVRNDHFVLIYVNLREREFLLLDPLGNERLIITYYFMKFSQFLLKKKIDITNWRQRFEDHSRQNDAVNCGVFVIYFFSKLISGENLTSSFDIVDYRRNLKWLLLENSSDMTMKCLFCSLLCSDNEKFYKCKSCNRNIHLKCLRTKVEMDKGITVTEKIMNGICDLCREN